MTFQILADVAASVTDLKRDPPARYQAMLELFEDLRLAELVRARQGEPTVAVDIDKLIAQAADTGA